jgi:3-hydroxy-5-phosphonooxypentane-2,4-dione thiolase
MGRNIFQSDFPTEMIQAIASVVHESFKPADAYQTYIQPALKAQPS